MPLGTAHDASTPSCSRRRSQWSARALCCWTTKRGARSSGSAATLPDGSGVRAKSRFSSYSVSLPRDFFGGTSEDRQWIHGGSGAARDHERGDDELELPAAELGADRGRGF